MNYQKTIIAGRLGRSPELKALPSGMSVATFSLAVNRTWKDKESGEKKEVTDWHDCKAFGKTAEVIAQYCKSGQVLLVEGRNQTSSWLKEGEETKRYKTEIIVENFQFGSSKNSQDESSDNDFKKEDPKHESPDWEEKSDGLNDVVDEIDPDDIPF